MFMLHHYDMGHSVEETVRFMNALYGNVVCKKTCALWHARFREDRSCQDKPRSGRPRVLIAGRLERTIASNRQQSSRKLASLYNCSPVTVCRYLRSLGYATRRLGYQPYKLNGSILAKRLTMASALLRKQRSHDLLSSLVTCDESKISLYSPYRGVHWVKRGTQPDLIPKQFPSKQWYMLCVFWNRHGVIHWELLDRNQSVDRHRYARQLETVSEKLNSAERVPLLHDNAPPHRARSTAQRADELGFDVLEHPPYSPDLSPTDYHLFRSLSNYLRNKSFGSKADLAESIENFFSLKSPDFYRRGIDLLETRWETVVSKRGAYSV